MRGQGGAIGGVSAGGGDLEVRGDGELRARRRSGGRRRRSGVSGQGAGEARSGK